MGVQNRIFGTFFVLIGAGIVGTIFGLVSFRIMEEQECLMNSRLTSFASKVGAIVEHHQKTTLARKNNNSLKSSSKKLALDVSQKSDNETDFRENESNPYKYSRWRHLVVSSKETIRRIFRINPKKEPCQDLSELNVAIFEDEISDLKITLVTNIIMFLLVLVIGALCMSAIEGWDITDAVYWVRMICVCVCMFVSMYAFFNFFVCVCMCVCMYVCMYVCGCVWTHVYGCTCSCIYFRISVNIYMMCMCICMLSRVRVAAPLCVRMCMCVRVFDSYHFFFLLLSSFIPLRFSFSPSHHPFIPFFALVLHPFSPSHLYLISILLLHCPLIPFLISLPPSLSPSATVLCHYMHCGVR